MNVSTMEALPQLDIILFDRPAGRNIIIHAIGTITAQRARIAELEGALQTVYALIDYNVRDMTQQDIVQAADTIRAALAKVTA